ncbi:hypothetical protein D9756_008509 [Leucocoprinus leucothites]|uniref:F-box domain-containing protein n=1 Tax=Leucocoprinus leucothites TaxID=201217 RepID=A0A8H5D0W3_9AGAR|nr:hypothetical protein D9756_008509 [Leucoagaricus leucothites]
MHLSTDPDIWTRILQFFRISLVDYLKPCQESAAAERSLNKQTLLSVALTCSSLLNPALSELWRSLSTLEYATKVYDTPTDSESGSSGFAFKYEEEGGYWTFNVATDQKEALAPRLRSYLRRIHCLRFEEFPNSREYTLWTILLVLSGSGSQGHLCPNLKGLFLLLKNVSPTMIYHLSPLISLSIESLDIDHVDEVENEKSTIVLLNLIRGHGTTSLRGLTYHGTSPSIFEEASHFHSLRKLNIKTYIKANPSLFKAPDIESLQCLRHLTRLSLDIRSFSWDAIEAARRWLGSLETLSELMLDGQWENIEHCVFKGITFHHIHHLRLFLTSPVGADLFFLLSLAFPALQLLGIQAQWDIRADSSLEFQLSDLMGLKARPMKKIALVNLPLHVSSGDIAILLTTWPLLEHITLLPDKAVRSGFVLDATFVLAQASRLGTRLKLLLLPLDFASLMATPTTSLPPAHSPLQQLILFIPNTVIPESLNEKQALVVKLLTLFPRLGNIDIISLGKHASNDLQSILDGFHQLLSSPPRRHERLFLN